MAVRPGSDKTVSRPLVLLALPLLVLALLAGGDGLGKSTSAAGGSVLTVTKQQDTNDGTCDADCSLREAIIAANSADDPSTIIVPASGTPYLITNGVGDDTGQHGDFDILMPITIKGAGIDQTIIDGNAHDTVFHVLPGGDLTLSDVTVTNGDGTQTTAVGGIYAQGDLTLDSSNVRDNVGGPQGAGGIYATANLTITDSVISGNHSRASGTGGIHSTGVTGETKISNTTIDANVSSGTSSVGGFFMEDNGDLADLTVSNNTASGENSTGGLYTYFNHETGLNRVKILDNSASGNYAVGGWWNDATAKAIDLVIDGNRGGAYGEGGLFIECCDGKLELSRATVSNNAAPNDSGGGIWNSGQSTLTNVTVSGNTAGSSGTGGVYNDSSLTLQNVTIAANSAGVGGTGGFWNDDMATVRNTIISGNIAANCHEGIAVASEGGNLSDDSGCGFTDALDHPGTAADAWRARRQRRLLQDPRAPATQSSHRRRRWLPAARYRSARSSASPGARVRQRRLRSRYVAVAVHGLWGDVRCDGGLGAEDAIALLQVDAIGDAKPASAECPTPDESVLLGVESIPRRWGDVNCDGTANVLDGLWILRQLAEIPLPHPPAARPSARCSRSPPGQRDD